MEPVFDPTIGVTDECYLCKTLEDGSIRCSACEHRCRIAPGRTGFCGVRKNDKGKLRLITYSNLSSLGIDPIEKKPLYHVVPGIGILSLAPVGCNFTCSFCQNWHISQIPLNARGDKSINDIEEGMGVKIKKVTPDDVAKKLNDSGLRALAFTYNEPGISFEYNYAVLRSVARLHDKSKGPIISVYVTNGFETPEQWDLLHSAGLSAVNIDLKSFTDEFYKRICGGRLEPVKASIKKTFDLGIHTEVTTLLIPGENDSDTELEELAKFLASVSLDIPWHISAFHPDYKMTEKRRTPTSSLERAMEIGLKVGIHHIYLGNVGEDAPTRCPKCKKELIIRNGFRVIKNLIKSDGKCPGCGEPIYGIWK